MARGKTPSATRRRSATYGSVSGIGKSDTLGYKFNSPPPDQTSDITLTDLRSMRGKVEAARWLGAVYMIPPWKHQSWADTESSTQLTPYVANGPNADVGRFPVRWVGIMPITIRARTSIIIRLLRRPQLWYFGERRGSTCRSRATFISRPTSRHPRPRTLRHPTHAVGNGVLQLAAS